MKIGKNSAWPSGSGVNFRVGRDVNNRFTFGSDGSHVVTWKIQETCERQGFSELSWNHKLHSAIFIATF